MEKLHWELSKIMDPVDDLLVIPLFEGCACEVGEHSSGYRSDWSGPPPSFRVI